MAAKNARDIMTQSPAVCTPESSARDGANQMEQNDCGSLPVVESRDSMKLIGMVTDRDLAIRILGRGQDPNTPIREAMTRNVSSVKADESLDDVERLMSGQQVRRIPVVDDHDRVLGIIAQADLARELRSVGTKDFSRVVEKISQPG
ncbi:MAG TPA: CBS domain-containing protein [Thermoanaerobaculia bacterium]|jgi:CBS-domain-containing membrane protein|nr:CBS domain-containing protein [Thermoanaerobaculia bacterium]